MKRMNKLLVATDFSAPARHAVMRSATLAQQLKAELLITHIIEPSFTEHLKALLKLDQQQTQQRAETNAKLQLNALMVAVNEQNDIKPTLSLQSGSLLPTLAEKVAQYAADLVLVSSKGEDFIRHWTLGSTAERLIRLLTCPMLLVKQSTQVSYRRVMIAVDFSDWSLSSIQLAQQIAPDAHYVLAHVFDVPEEGKLRMAGINELDIINYRNELMQERQVDLKRLAQQAELSDAQWSPLVMKGNASSRLLEAEEDQDIDLIVLGKHGKGWFEEMLLGSTTKHLLTDSNTDLLIAQRAESH
jgi:nucleotide-binding universal stress UspA family protein